MIGLWILADSNEATWLNAGNHEGQNQKEEVTHMWKDAAGMLLMLLEKCAYRDTQLKHRFGSSTLSD